MKWPRPGWGGREGGKDQRREGSKEGGREGAWMVHRGACFHYAGVALASSRSDPSSLPVPGEGNCFDSVQGHLSLKLFKKLLGEIEEAWSERAGVGLVGRNRSVKEGESEEKGMGKGWE